MKAKDAKATAPVFTMLIAAIGITTVVPICSALGMAVVIAISPIRVLGSCVIVMAITVLVLRRKWHKGVGPPGNARSFILAIAYCCVFSKLYTQPKDDEDYTGVNLSRCAIIADGFPDKILNTNPSA